MGYRDLSRSFFILFFVFIFFSLTSLFFLEEAPAEPNSSLFVRRAEVVKGPHVNGKSGRIVDVLFSFSEVDKIDPTFIRVYLPYKFIDYAPIKHGSCVFVYFDFVKKRRRVWLVKDCSGNIVLNSSQVMEHIFIRNDMAVSYHKGFLVFSLFSLVLYFLFRFRKVGR